ncbi:hypothetical protein D9M69_492650 [compost metagenome]
MAGNGVAIDALAFLGEPLDEGGGIDDLALGLGQRLALLGGHQAGQVVLVLDHQLEPAAQAVGALLGGQRAPGRQRLVGSLDGAAGLGSAHLRHSADDLAGSRVVHLDGLAAVGIDPGAVDVGLLTEQRGVFELHDLSPSRNTLSSGGYLVYPVCLVVRDWRGVRLIRSLAPLQTAAPANRRPGDTRMRACATLDWRRGCVPVWTSLGKIC